MSKNSREVFNIELDNGVTIGVNKSKSGHGHHIWIDDDTNGNSINVFVWRAAGHDRNRPMSVTFWDSDDEKIGLGWVRGHGNGLITNKMMNHNDGREKER